MAKEDDDEEEWNDPDDQGGERVHSPQEGYAIPL
jgi:hypothetical protein